MDAIPEAGPPGDRRDPGLGPHWPPSQCLPHLGSPVGAWPHAVHARRRASVGPAPHAGEEGPRGGHRGPEPTRGAPGLHAHGVLEPSPVGISRGKPRLLRYASWHRRSSLAGVASLWCLLPPGETMEATRLGGSAPRVVPQAGSALGCPPPSAAAPSTEDPEKELELRTQPQPPPPPPRPVAVLPT